METPEPKEKPPEARAWIDQGTLKVEIPLFMPNGEYVAYGMLHKAMSVVDKFFRAVEKEAEVKRSGSRILIP